MRRRAPRRRAILHPHFHGHGKVTEELAELAERAPLGYSSDDGYRVRVAADGAAVARESSPRPARRRDGPQQQAGARRAGS